MGSYHGDSCKGHPSPATMRRWLTTSMGTMTDWVTRDATAPAKELAMPAFAASLGAHLAIAAVLRLQDFVASRVVRYTCAILNLAGVHRSESPPLQVSVPALIGTLTQIVLQACTMLFTGVGLCLQFHRHYYVRIASGRNSRETEVLQRAHSSGWYDAHYHNPKASVEAPDAVCGEHLAHNMSSPLQRQ